MMAKKERKIIRKNKSETPKKELSFSLLEVIIVMIITIVFGMMIGGLANSFKAPISTTNTKLKSESSLNEFIEVYNELKNKYYGEIKSEEMIEAGIEGMLNYLNDTYSVYMRDSSSRSFNDEMDGEYVGLGVQITKVESGLIKILSVFPDSPAEKVGIKVDDEIVKVNKLEVKDTDIDRVVEEIRGKVGTKFDVVISRAGEEKSYKVTREAITLTSVTGEIHERDNKKVAYLRVSTFAANTTSQFKKLLDSYIEKDKVSAVIVDLRNNTGGHLAVADSLASLFLDKGKIIYQLKDKKETTVSKSSNAATYKIPVIFITNEGSASASEVLVAALKENGLGLVVGKKTFGKSSVQTAKELSSGSTIKYTIREWLTPKGNSLEENGIDPDIEVELADEYYETREQEKDSQLMRALTEAFKEE